MELKDSDIEIEEMTSEDNMVDYWVTIKCGTKEIAEEWKQFILSRCSNEGEIGMVIKNYQKLQFESKQNAKDAKKWKELELDDEDKQMTLEGARIIKQNDEIVKRLRKRLETCGFWDNVLKKELRKILGGKK